LFVVQFLIKFPISVVMFFALTSSYSFNKIDATCRVLYRMVLRLV